MIHDYSWTPVPRYDGNRIYTAYRCPHCTGTGHSPYHDLDGNRTPCEACHGNGYRKP